MVITVHTHVVQVTETGFSLDLCHGEMDGFTHKFNDKLQHCLSIGKGCVHCRFSFGLSIKNQAMLLGAGNV